MCVHKSPPGTSISLQGLEQVQLVSAFCVFPHVMVSGCVARACRLFLGIVGASAPMLICHGY